MKDIAIVGAGPAGYSAAITARKRDKSVVVIGQNTGWLAHAHSIANYPGLPDISGHDLLEAMKKQAQDLGAELRPGVVHQIVSLGSSFALSLGADFIEAERIILCTGAKQPKLLPGESELLGRGVSYCGTCDGMFYRGKKVAVLSAWTGGVEEAEFLAGLASEVDYYLLAQPAQPENPPYRLCAGKPQSIRREANQLVLVTDAGEHCYDGIFIFRPAVSPDTLLPGLKTEGAFIPVDRRMATNLPRVYACGDCTGQPLQIAKAVGEGNVAAISASADLSKGARA